MATYKKRGSRTELNRFCSKIDTIIVGGLSKLLKRMPDGIIESFVDLRYATGDSLKTLGFTLESCTLGWRWTDAKITYNRHYCRANQDSRNLSERAYAKEAKLFKIYDAGQAKWVRR